DELGGIAFRQHHQVAGRVTELRGECEQRGGDEVGFPRRVAHEFRATSCRLRSRWSRFVKCAYASFHPSARGLGVYEMMSDVVAITRRMSARSASSPRATSCVAALPSPVASTGPQWTGSPAASAVS